MKDRNVEFPSRYLMEPVEGMPGVVDLIPAPGRIFEAGTPWNKATWLSDGTAADLWPDAAERPDDPTVNDALNSLKQSLLTVQSGSYIGTGGYGADNKNSLNFSFPPKVLFLYGRVPRNVVNVSFTFQTVIIPGYVFTARSYGNVYYYDIDIYQHGEGDSFSVTSFGKKVEWYARYDSAQQMNYSNEKYIYLAIG